MNFESSDLMGKVFLFMKRLMFLFNEKMVRPVKNALFTSARFLKNSFILLLRSLKRTIIAVKKLIFRSPETPEKGPDPEPEPVTEAQWKITALEDFRLWLSQIPSEQPPVMTATPDTCDLYTMLSEFTALRQEIRMQNREQHRTVNALNSVKGVTDEYGEIYTLFKEKTTQIAQLEQNIRLNSEKKSATCFFDVRDSLVRGYRASVEMAGRKGFFRRPPKDIHTICEGYEMAISRFDKALSMMDIEPIQTDSTPFNPETMKVVERREVSGIENAMVLETVSGGFMRGREVLRFANVIVAQAPNAS